MGFIKNSKQNTASHQECIQTQYFLDSIFRSHFGIPLSVYTLDWNHLGNTGQLSESTEPNHLLWALIFLKLTLFNMCNIKKLPS